MTATSEVITARIPRYVLDFNDLVRGCGVTTQAKIVELGSDDAYGVIEVGWCGSRSRLADLAFVLGVPASWRPPLKEGAPPIALMHGTLRIVGDDFEFLARIDLPTAVTGGENVETMLFDDATWYYGSREALIASGLRGPEHFPKVRDIRSNVGGWVNMVRQRPWPKREAREVEPRWWTRRLPTGKYVCSLERPESAIGRYREEIEDHVKHWGSDQVRIARMRKALAAAERAFMAKSDAAFAVFMAQVTTPRDVDGQRGTD